jgi:hypothetical protein
MRKPAREARQGYLRLRQCIVVGVVLGRDIVRAQGRLDLRDLRPGLGDAIVRLWWGEER